MIYHFTSASGASFPAGNVFSGLSQLSKIVTPNVPRIFFVSPYKSWLTLIERFLTVTNRLFPIPEENLQKYNFVETLSEAIDQLPVELKS